VEKEALRLTFHDALETDEDDASVDARPTLLPLLYPWKAVARR
jgi:hypothetical protein